MADVPQYVADEIVDQVMKVLKDKATSKLLKITKQKNLSEEDVKYKLREMGFKNIANDPNKFEQFKKISKLPLSQFQGRAARLLVGVSATMGKEKFNKLIAGKGRATKAVAGAGYTIFRGSTKDFAEKTGRNIGIKRILDKPDLMKNIAKSLKEKNK
jgi:hypothetical protein